MVWYRQVLILLRESALFTEVHLIGAKIRAFISETVFLDIHYDPSTGSYSYALIDLSAPYPGDKRVLGWDDYPHEGIEALRQLRSYPHHFQRRDEQGQWVFEESAMRGDVERDVEQVLEALRAFLGSGKTGGGGGLGDVPPKS
jgi:hypothetical protein